MICQWGLFVGLISFGVMTSCLKPAQTDSDLSMVSDLLGKFPTATPLSKSLFYRSMKTRLGKPHAIGIGPMLQPIESEVGRPEIIQMIMGTDLRETFKTKFKIQTAPDLISALDQLTASSQGQMNAACSKGQPSCKDLKGETAKLSQQWIGGKPGDPGSILDTRFYLWDNWFVVYKNTIFRFTLQSPKIFPKDHPQAGSPVGYDDRHELASIGLYTSKDGNRWEYQGAVIEPESGPGKESRFDSKVIWSGNATVIKDQLVVPYTGRSKVAGRDPWLQKIGVALFNPATQTFSRLSPNPVLDPGAKDSCGLNIAEKLGYDLSSSPKVIMAWRDPYLLVQDQKVHMFFAAKKKLARPSEDNSAVGHAVASIHDLSKWTLLPPLNLPRSYSQMELPIVIKQGNSYVLLSSVVEFTDKGRVQTLRAYRNTGFDGPWKPFSSRGDLALQLNKVYGINVAKDLKEQLSAVSFDMKSLGLTSLKPLQIGPDSITIQGLESWEQ